MSSLTRRQSDVLETIKASIATSGASPPYRQIAAKVGLASTSGVARIIDGLEERGAIRRLPFKSCALVVVDDDSRTDVLAFLPPETLYSVRRFAQRKTLTCEAAVAEILRLYFSSRVPS